MIEGVTFCGGFGFVIKVKELGLDGCVSIELIEARMAGEKALSASFNRVEISHGQPSLPTNSS
jgi:hypothetical protein